MIKSGIKRVKGLTLSILFLMGISFMAFSQNNNVEKSSKFLFSIQKTQTGLTLKGIEGCAWKNLSFSIVEGGTQVIDQYGMASLKRGPVEETDKLSNFQIIIKKTKKGIELKGVEGTSFINLNYSGGNNDRVQLIDNNGMVEPAK